MKPFNLELAIAGHPLISRGGEKVLEFRCFENLRHVAFPCRAVMHANSGRSMLSFSLSGASYSFSGSATNVKSQYDLFLDDSVEWERPLEIGDDIECLFSGDWETRLIVAESNCGGCWYALKSEEMDLKANSDCLITFCGKGHWRRKKKKKQIFTVEYAGEKIELSEGLNAAVEI